MHPIIDCLVFHVITLRDSGFQIDDAHIGFFRSKGIPQM